MNAPGAVEVHPTDPNIVFIGENNRIQRTVDGGNTWELLFQADNLYANDIKFNPVNPDIILIATQAGLFRTINGGQNWDIILPNATYDIEWKTDDPTICFVVNNDPVLGICKFYKSTDSGATWNVKQDGWYFSDLPGHTDYGARLAVTDADPNRLYAVLIGEAKTGDDGFIGIYRSDDAGETWTLPNPPAGGPYDETNHPDMATIGHTGGYHQGFYNLGFDASDSDPDFLMAGFTSLWYSTNGAATWTCFGGYCGNNFNYVHPDCQEIEINGDDIWMTSDGGIEHSTDHFQSHYAVNLGITGSDFWGFGTGWNEDILVGGRYHNGNTAWKENWNAGEFLSLGGGEAATGYVNPGEGRKAYFSDIGGIVIPEEENDDVEHFQFGKYPNESYYDAESGEMEFSPICWNHIYVTNENKLWKSIDGGKSWDILHEFGNDVNARAMSFEISRQNPLVMYLFQRDEYSWDPGLLWKTVDGGVTWTNLTFPPGYARRCLLTVNAQDENDVWIAFPDGGDGEKIYSSRDGGMSWENWTTPDLDGEHITYMFHESGLDGGIFLGTFRTVWYRFDIGDDWFPYSDGLPAQIAVDILKPFYRDGLLRLAAYGKGIWEAPLIHTFFPAAQPMANTLETSCPGDTIHFDDYSILVHNGGSWNWHFPGGTPNESHLRNPKVVYTEPGEYPVTLVAIFDDVVDVKSISGMIHVLPPEINPVPPILDFSNTDNFTIINPDDTITWEPVLLTSCDPVGDTAYYVHNYIYSGYGQDELVLPANMDLTQIINPTLSFDVAYAPYFDGNYFIDSLLVKLTNNCGKSYHIIFRSGGADLSTTTSGIGTDSLYEYDAFSPQNCDEWRHVVLDLSAYAGQYVTISFLNKSGYGNNIYLDNILLEGESLAVPYSLRKTQISLQPNPAAENIELSAETLSGKNIKLQIYTMSGVMMSEKKVGLTSGSWNEQMNIKDFPPGTYLIKMISDQQELWTGTFIKL